MNVELYDILDELASEFLEEDLVKEYKSLNKLIEDKYAKEIVLFQSAKEKLLEMKKYTKDLKVYEQSLLRCKETLFLKPEVKRLKELERILSNQLVELSNDISKYLSNKFLTKKGFI